MAKTTQSDARPARTFSSSRITARELTAVSDIRFARETMLVRVQPPSPLLGESSNGKDNLYDDRPARALPSKLTWWSAALVTRKSRFDSGRGLETREN